MPHEPIKYGVSDGERVMLIRNFTYHSPKADQPERYARLRDGARNVAEMILDFCPDSREKSLALTKIEESVMWAKTAIAAQEK